MLSEWLHKKIDALRPPQHDSVVKPSRDSISVWTVADVAAYLQSESAELCPAPNRIMRPRGFDLFSDRFIARARGSSERYPDPATLPVWQQQSHGDCGAHEFDRALVARHGELVTGILYCEWYRARTTFPKESFWCYTLNFIDVHTEWRNKGIATTLIQALDKQEWLSQKILWLTSFSRDGQEFLPRVLTRELNASNYIVLPSDYAYIALPQEAGIWESPTERGSVIQCPYAFATDLS